MNLEEYKSLKVGTYVNYTYESADYSEEWIILEILPDKCFKCMCTYGNIKEIGTIKIWNFIWESWKLGRYIEKPIENKIEELNNINNTLLEKFDMLNEEVQFLKLKLKNELTTIEQALFDRHIKVGDSFYMQVILKNANDKWSEYAVESNDRFFLARPYTKIKL